MSSMVPHVATTVIGRPMRICINMVMALWFTYHANVIHSAYTDISVGILSRLSVKINTKFHRPLSLLFFCCCSASLLDWLKLSPNHTHQLIPNH